jgi:hypothetical protein
MPDLTWREGVWQRFEGTLGNVYVFSQRSRLLTEQQISKSWRTLLCGRAFDTEVDAKAEALLDELRPESPLRHRLRAELDELRRMRLQKAHN